LCVTEKATSKGRKRKRKRKENKAGSPAAATGDQQPGNKMRKRDQGQAKKAGKKVKARKSQFERRNIRWSIHYICGINAAWL